MKYDKFIREVKDRAGLDDREEAERTTVVVLRALSDRLTGDEADDLLAQLPEPLKETITVSQPAMRMTATEFGERIAGELDISPDEARKRVPAVFGVLADAVTPGEFLDMLVQLPSGYVELLPQETVMK